MYGGYCMYDVMYRCGGLGGWGFLKQLEWWLPGEKRARARDGRVLRGE